MKITDVKAFTVMGEFPFEGEQYMEDRLVRPIDIYPEYKVRGPRATRKVSPNAMEINSLALFWSKFERWAELFCVFMVENV